MEFLLSAGNDHDSVHAVELLKKVRISGSAILADRAYGARAIREYISEHGASYVIPPQSNVSDPWPVDWHRLTGICIKSAIWWSVFSRKSSGFAELPPDMTSRLLPSWPLCILPPSLFCCFSTISAFFQTRPRVCFKTIKVTKQGYRQDRQQRENRVLSSHIWWQIWWQNGGCFSA